MAYFSEIARKAINAAHGEKMTDWEGKKASDNHDVYSRDDYMPIEDANTRRHYRARGGTIPELEAKRGGRMHHADGSEVAECHGGYLKKRAHGGSMPRDMYPIQKRGGIEILADVEHCRPRRRH